MDRVLFFPERQRSRQLGDAEGGFAAETFKSGHSLSFLQGSLVERSLRWRWKERPSGKFHQVI